MNDTQFTQPRNFMDGPYAEALSAFIVMVGTLAVLCWLVYQKAANPFAA